MQLDPTKLTEDQRYKLEQYNQVKEQLQTLHDIADMTQEMLSVMDARKSEDGKNDKQTGALLVDMRDAIQALKDKETPESPDYAAPVVKAVDNLGKALTDSIKSIDVKPDVNISAPEPSVDMTGVEKAIGEIPQAFTAAIELIHIPDYPETDFQPLLDAWQGISEQLLSIENATRMKPLPGSIKVTNLSDVADAISLDNPKYAAFQFDPSDALPTYIGKNTDPDAVNNSSDWVVYKFTYSGSDVTSIIKRTGSWTNRASL